MKVATEMKSFYTCIRKDILSGSCAHAIVPKFSMVFFAIGIFVRKSQHSPLDKLGRPIKKCNYTVYVGPKITIILLFPPNIPANIFPQLTSFYFDYLMQLV